MVLTSMSVFAQPKTQSRPDRKEWMAKMLEVRRDFLSKELQLTDAQKKEFFEAYDKCQEARHRIEHDARQHEKAIEQKGDAATDAELDAVIAELYSIEERLAKVDKEYLPQLRKVLTRRQLAKLKHAERKFTRKLMEKHSDASHQKPKPQK